MKYLLDTNVLSDARRRSSQSLNDWLEVQPAVDLVISAVSILEIDIGVRTMERRDPRQGSALRDWFQRQVLGSFRGRVLPVDARVAMEAAALHVPDPMPDMDALIAATARTHDLTLVTRNVADFARTGVPILNPWE